MNLSVCEDSSINKKDYAQFLLSIFFWPHKWVFWLQTKLAKKIWQTQIIGATICKRREFQFFHMQNLLVLKSHTKIPKLKTCLAKSKKIINYQTSLDEHLSHFFSSFVLCRLFKHVRDILQVTVALDHHLAQLCVDSSCLWVQDYKKIFRSKHTWMEQDTHFTIHMHSMHFTVTLVISVIIASYFQECIII